MPLGQQARTLSVSTPLGEDVLLLRSMSASERLGTLFEYELELISEDIDIKHEDLLGRSATVRLRRFDDQERFFNGIVNSFSQVGFDGSAAVYNARLVPWTWFLTRTADCRIFQEKTVPDIIKEIFREHGFTDFEESLSGSYRQWIYCVQYRETDFNFISRLMEQEGIYYYFKHEDGKHTLILADSYSAHSTVSGYEEIPYYPPDETSLRERDHISDWSVVQAVQPGVFAHTDFDFTAPKKNLLTKRGNPKSHELADYEIYDYPGDYLQTGNGETYARVRLEEMHAGYETARAEGNARGLATGALFNLTNYRREDQNREYLIVAASYELQSDAFGSSGSAAGGPLFQCSLSAIDAQIPFRSPRITPKPTVQGPQTAIVVGKPGEEIWTDKYGRVKVQFHWDRYGKYDENSSCWVRVSHPWAGKKWGSVAIPRIGQEVIVDFLEGDPDQPIITGRVYNRDCMPPYELPAGAVVSGMKSNSTKGGGGYNEFIMDDTKGNEMVREHAQFNKDTTVENDQTLTVHNNRTSTIDVDDSEKVGSNQTIQVGGSQSTTVGGNRSITVGGSQSTSVGGSRSANVGGNDSHTVSGSQTVQAAGSQTLSTSAVQTVKAGGSQVFAAGSSQTIKAGATQTVEVGGSQSVSVAGSIKVVGASIRLSAGGSTIEISPGGIKITSGGPLDVSAGGPINIAGGGPVGITGPTVKVN